MHIRDKIKALTPKLTRQGYAHISRAGTSNRGKPRVNVNVTEGRHPSQQKKPVATPRGKMPTPSSRGVRGSGNPLGNSTPNVDRVQFRHNVSRGAAQEIQGVAGVINTLHVAARPIVLHPIHFTRESNAVRITSVACYAEV